jgi:hypothetical protein
MRTGCVVSCPVRAMNLMKKREKDKGNNRVLEGIRESGIRSWGFSQENKEVNLIEGLRRK